MQSIGADKWPSCGGANGSIRFDPEMGHGANAGLPNAVYFLEPVKAQFPDIGYADLFQLASATAVEVNFYTHPAPTNNRRGRFCCTYSCIPSETDTHEVLKCADQPATCCVTIPKDFQSAGDGRARDSDEVRP